MLQPAECCKIARNIGCHCMFAMQDWHPDRHRGDEGAKIVFQEIVRAYQSAWLSSTMHGRSALLDSEVSVYCMFTTSLAHRQRVRRRKPLHEAIKYLR
jgi:hypothetical protein